MGCHLPDLKLSFHHAFQQARTYIARVEQSWRSEKMKQEKELASNVRAADLTQLLARLDADMSLLITRENNAPSRAVETAKDMKYLWERQTMLVVVEVVSDFFGVAPPNHDVWFILV